MTREIEGLNAALAGRYRIERKLASGGMANVYLADDLKHGRSVALKVLRPELAQALGPERFLREIEIAAGLNHPHIIPLHDSGQAGGFLYYVMPFVEGESLRDRLRREKQLPIADALAITRDVADALSFAHQKGIVHRDIKPENIMLHAGHAAVADFGIARALNAAGATTLTAPGMMVGTPEYMSPEQAGGGGDEDSRSDIYSLGCVVYEMLGGQPPFVGATVENLVRQHLAAEPAPIDVLRTTVSPATARALARALAKTPADRFATADGLAAALESGETGSRPGTKRARLVGFTGVALAAVALVGLGMRTKLGERSPVSRAAASLAVIPFTPADRDTALIRLGRDLAVTVSANLDGVGGIRAADALSVLAQFQENTIPLERGIDVAGRLAASSFVYGSLIRAGAAVRVDYALYETEKGASLARGSVTAVPDDLRSLTDSITWKLLRAVWRTGEPPAPSLEAITTRSLPALRAYLEGEQLLSQGRFFEAPEAFARAIEADSSFWYAYWRYNYAMAYHGRWVSPEIREAILEHYQEFPERDRLIIEARMAGSMSERGELARRAAERYPNYWPAWFDYADHLVHSAPFLGVTLEDSRPSLERVAALNPNFMTVWQHLYWIPLYNPDTASARSYLEEMARLGFDSISRADVGLPGLIYLEYLLTLAGSGGKPNPIGAELASYLRGYRGRISPLGVVSEFSDYGFHQAQFEFNDRLVQVGVPEPFVSAAERVKGSVWAARGQWDSAMVQAERHRRRTAGAEAVRDGYQLAVVGAWLGAVDTSTALTWRGRMASATAALPAESQAGVRWLDGLLAVARRDRAGLRNARDALAASEAVTAPGLTQSLDAFGLGLDGDGAGAARALHDLEWERAERYAVRSSLTAHSPYLTGVNRLAAACGLLAAGDTAEATRLLTWHEAVWPGGSDTRTADAVLASIAFFERGKIEQARGRLALAREYYRQFLRRYDAPSQSVEHLVREAEAAIGRTEGN